MKKIILTFILGIVAFACSDNEPGIDNAYVNGWILENMEFLYFWNEEIPTTVNKQLDPENFFASLLSNEDRFSWIQDDFEELLKSLQGVNKEAGYEFKLYRESQGSDNLIMQIMYVKENSPAKTAGLLRGDVIDKVNGTQLTVSNYQSMLGLLSENHSLHYKRYNWTTKVFEDKGTLSLTTVEFAENPNYYSTIYTLGSHKVGYYIYNFFATGPTQSSSTYNSEMDQVFSEFKSSGITDLIIDLRFNSGGAESATINLASLIGVNVDNSQIFVKRKYNSLVEAEILNDPGLGAGFLTTKFINKTQNVGSLLTSNRVYILTSSRSASASELLINGLKPFMDVKIVGDTTYGKNYGSITITDNENKKNKWGMQPIIVRSYNKNDQSDYSTGFYPDIIDLDNALELYPLGDVNERLLNIALEDITGTAVGGRKREMQELSIPIFNSLDLQRRDKQLYRDLNGDLLKKLAEK